VAGSWPAGASLAASGEIPSTEPGSVRVLGAGIDPANIVFKGALMNAFRRDESGAGETMDLSALRLEGALDFELDVEVREDEVPGTQEYRVFLRGNALETETLRLEDLRGVLALSKEVLRGPRVLGALGGHPIELRDVMVARLADTAGVDDVDPLLREPGYWSDPDGLVVQAEVHVRDLPLDEERLAHLLDPATLDLLRRSVVWEGQLDALGAKLVITGEHESGGKTALHGVLVPHDLSMRLGLPIEIESARLDIQKLVLEAGRVRGWGEIEALDARIAGRELRDARMTLTYVDGRVTIDNLSGAFEGGRLASLGAEDSGAAKALAIDLASPYRFDLALRMDDVRVDRLLRGVFRSSIADHGRADLDLQLRGSPGDVLGLVGSGWVKLDDARLWSIPVMRELFQQLGFDQTAIFDRMRARLQVRDGRLLVSDAKISSALLNLVGNGTLDFDGRLHFDLEVRYGILDVLGPLTRILYWFNNNLWRVAVRGSMSRPRVSIRNAILEILARFEDRPPRALPLPDFAELPARF
jgi:hypothetical protein